MTIHDVDHYTEDEKENIIASYPAHEREARANGIPQLGSGRIYPIAEDQIKVEATSIPDIWHRICGIDFGGSDHPTASVWLAWDKDADAVHLYDCYKQRVKPGEAPEGGNAIIHAAAIKPRGDWIPISWPFDGLQHDKGSGKELRSQYQDQGLNMLPDHATWEAGGYGVEAGIQKITDMMLTGRFTVASHLEDWWSEFRLYHRKDGKIVKEFDDLMDATRYAVMMLRFAETKPRPKNMSFASAW